MTASRLALVVALCLVSAPPARAATVTAPAPTEEYPATHVTVARANGESNSLAFAERADFKVVVRELGSAPLEAGGACEQTSERRVVCPPARALTLDLGTGSDSATVHLESTRTVTADGGDGDDSVAIQRVGLFPNVTLRGGRGRDTLLGSDGRDRLYGGAGADIVSGRGGSDVLFGDGGHSSAGHDQIWGGPGFDLASWSDRRVPVRVDLRGAARGGTDGEDDVLSSIVAVTGGKAGDVLVGDGGPNFLRGGRGPDLLRGRGDADRLEGGPGPDELSAGDGNDVLDGGSSQTGAFTDGVVDRLACADRNDVVLSAVGDGARSDPIPQSCERVAAVFTVAVPRLRLGATRVMVEVECSQPGATRQVRLVSRGEELGRSDTENCDHHPRDVEVPLAEPLAAGPPIRVVFDGQENFTGQPEPFHVSYRVIRPSAY